MAKTLYLSLKKIPFNEMISGNKTEEFRKPSKWIKSRLFNKDGSEKNYDFIKFTNGYGNDKPYFIAQFDGVTIIKENQIIRYSSNLSVRIKTGDYMILLGDIIRKTNIN